MRSTGSSSPGSSKVRNWPDDGAPLAPFDPGQFLTFELPGDDGPVLRTYSLSDSPDRPYYRVSIKREAAPGPDVPPGFSSTYFHDRVEVGTQLRVAAPRGKLVLDDRPERALVLLSAGVGITPLLSMANAVARSGVKRTVWFVHGARSGLEAPFGPHLRALASEHENLNVHIAYSRPRAEDQLGRDYDTAGRVDVPLLKRLLPFDDYEFYLVGPTPFMRDLHEGLTAIGVDASRIHYELFGPGSLLPKASDAPGAKDARDEVGEGLEVAFRRSGVRASWSSGTLLELAESQGLDLPYSCRSGICQTCSCRLEEGEIEYVDTPLAKPPDGEVLVCIARPKTPVVLDA